MKTKGVVSFILLVFLVIFMSACNSEEVKTAKAGTYEVTATGMGGEFKVEVSFDEDGKIAKIDVGDHLETPGVGTVAFEKMSDLIVETQNLEVDSISGATITCNALKRGVSDAIEVAEGDLSAYKLALPEKDLSAIEKKADVIIVGGGGAGLSAAVAATDEGASVIVMEKMGILGGNTIVCGGIYNSPSPDQQAAIEMTEGVKHQVEEALNEEPLNEEHQELIARVQKQYDDYQAAGSKGLFDSAQWFALQTWNGGDKVAKLKIVNTFAENAADSLEWVKGMGAEFSDDIMQGAGALYQRTHGSKDLLGTGYIDAYLRTLKAREDKCEIIMNAEAQELILDGDKVIGVKGKTTDGAPITLMADKNVILATGGFAGNVDMREKYNTSGKWDDLGESVLTTNMPGVTGDGINMAEKANANLLDMEHIQLLHLGNPKLDGAITGLNFENNAAIYMFINQDGERFVREDGRRDEICKAILEQRDGMMYLLNNELSIPDPDLTTTKEGMTITDEEEVVGWIFSGETLEELAKKVEMPVENLKASVEEFNASVEKQEDKFGRELFKEKLESGPWYALARVPSAHHTMGGVEINELGQALDKDGNAVEGLYCAGEITGGLHGANRLGGNAVVDTVVFGRIAGMNAAK